MKDILWSLLAGLVLSWSLVLVMMYAPTGIVAVATPDVIPAHYYVQSGDSLWIIARQYWPGGHTGRRVHGLKELNPHLGDVIYPGDLVRLREAE